MKNRFKKLPAPSIHADCPVFLHLRPFGPGGGCGGEVAAAPNDFHITHSYRQKGVVGKTSGPPVFYPKLPPPTPPSRYEFHFDGLYLIEPLCLRG